MLSRVWPLFRRALYTTRSLSPLARSFSLRTHLVTGDGHLDVGAAGGGKGGGGCCSCGQAARAPQVASCAAGRGQAGRAGRGDGSARRAGEEAAGAEEGVHDTG